MSQNKTPLETLLDLAQTRTDEAARQLGKLIAAESQDAKKLALLQQYREDYQARFVAHARNGMRPEEWANYQHFLAKLDAAIEQQSRMCAISQGRTAAGQQAWLEQRNRHKAIDTLSQRQEAQAAKLAARAEQKSSDEHAAKQREVGFEASMDAGGMPLAQQYSN